jgi:hypothetical protein
VVFTLATRLDRLGLPLRPSLAGVLSADLAQLISGFAALIAERVGIIIVVIIIIIIIIICMQHQVISR